MKKFYKYFSTILIIVLVVFNFKLPSRAVNPLKLMEIEAVLKGETTWEEIWLNKKYDINPERVHFYNGDETFDKIYTLPSAPLADEERDFLAKLLYAEAGSMTWEGQVYTCSAILNLCDSRDISIFEGGHNEGMFSVAPYVDFVEPMQMQYDVIEYVCNGGRIADIKYFQCGWYHNFGTPVCNIENVYFSM